MVRRGRAGVAFVATVMIGLVLAACGSGGSRNEDEAVDLDDFAFTSLEVDYTLTRAEDGTSRMRVVEEFVAEFPDADQNRGMRRLIPDSYNDQPTRPTLVSVTDENGAPRPAETDTDDGAYGILSRGEDYLHGRQTFVFTYDLENVVWDFDDTGLELNWDVNGTDWAQPFGSVTARLHLDDELAARATGDRSCYAGPDGATDSCDDIVAQDGGRTIVATAADLGPHETLTLAVGFDDGTFALFDDGYFASPFGWLQSGSALVLVGVTAWAVAVRRRRLRSEPGRPVVVAEFSPPEGIDALESAVLLGRTSAAIPAEVLEQAIVGSIRIVEGPRPAWGRAKLQAELVDPGRADGDGRMLLDGLFPGGEPGAVYEFGSSDTRLSTTAQKILKSAGEDLRGRGMYRVVAPGTRALPVTAWVLAAAAVIVFGVLALSASVAPVVPAVLIGVAFGTFFVVLFALAVVPLSAQGAEVRDHLAGLKTFIAWAEEDRIRMLQSPEGAERVRVDTGDPREMLRLYERLLPYAVVFGQEKEWAKHLTVLYAAVGVAAPVWYAGSSAFDASSFAAGIGSLSATASASSSTSGGSGGGGSAGGGGGGGGGGGA